MRPFQFLINFMLIFLLSVTSWGGGIPVGNGSGDDESANNTLRIDKTFEIRIPNELPQIKTFQDGILLEGPPTLGIPSQGMGKLPRLERPKIIIQKFREKRPEMASMSKLEILQFLNKNSWSRYEGKEPCVVAQYKTQENTITAIVTWGSGEGYIASADNQDKVRSALQKMVESTTSDTPGCLWK